MSTPLTPFLLRAGALALLLCSLFARPAVATGPGGPGAAGDTIYVCDLVQSNFLPISMLQYNGNTLSFVVNHDPNTAHLLLSNWTFRVRLMGPGVNQVLGTQTSSLPQAIVQFPYNVSAQVQLACNQMYEIHLEGDCMPTASSNTIVYHIFNANNLIPSCTSGTNPNCPPLTGSIISSTNSIGIGNIIQFTYSDPSVSNIQWNFGPGANPATANGPGPHSVSYSTSGTKSIAITYAANSGCPQTTRVVSSVNIVNCTILANTFALQPAFSSYNVGNPVQLIPNGYNTPAGASYNWTISPSTFAVVAGNPSAGPHTIVFSQPGSYTISLAYTAQGCSTRTVSRTVRVLAACDSVVGPISFSNVTGSTAQVNWNNAGSNVGYQVLYRLAGTNVWSSVQAPANASFALLSNLQPNSQYQVVVLRICSNGVQSAPNVSPTILSTNMAPSPCAGPANFQVSSSTSNSLTVSWSPVPGATSYVVHIRPVGASAYVPFNYPATAASATFNNLSPATAYEVMIYAGCSGLRSPFVTATGSTASLKQIEEARLSLYPNPLVDGKLKIKADNMTSGTLEVQILNLTGQVVHTQSFENPLGLNIEADMELNLAPGTYLLKATGGLNDVQRIVVK